MAEIENTISEKNSYYTQMTISSISKYKVCLDEFSKNFANEVTLNSKTPLFLDTNILLRYYSISFIAREKLFDFLKKNKDRIYFTSQVQIEYLRNREDIIQRFFEQVTSKIPKDFNAEIVNKMKSFLDQYKVVLKDYSFVEQGIDKYQTELEELLKKLNVEVESKKNEHNNLIVKDKFLDFLSTCNQVDELNKDEIKLIKKHFDILAQNITSEKVDSIIKKNNGAFPGLGDIKEKPEDPYGDYIIFHEIMKFMIEKNTDAALLTFDNTKGDWMSKNKTPYLHYIQNVYNNTGKILYIIDAERALGEILNVDINSLIIENVESEQSLITPEALLNVVKKSRVFEGAAIGNLDDIFIKELTLNGYITIEQIEQELKRFEYNILQYRKKTPNLNTLGVMRCGLRIANPNYTLQVDKNDGSVKQIPNSRLEDYRMFSKLQKE